METLVAPPDLSTSWLESSRLSTWKGIRGGDVDSCGQLLVPMSTGGCECKQDLLLSGVKYLFHLLIDPCKLRGNRIGELFGVTDHELMESPQLLSDPLRCAGNFVVPLFCRADAPKRHLMSDGVLCVPCLGARCYVQVSSEAPL